MPIKQIAHVNVRLSEGGAAGVAQNMAKELEKLGITSPFIYGYGPHGRSSSAHDDDRNLRTTPSLFMAANMLSHSLVGHETSLLLPSVRKNMEKLIEQSDIIHLHAIHSYFINPLRLLDMLARAGKPVVWTLHDQWIMTGRCAQPAGCERWKQGCPTCPNLAAYPPARIDRASRNWSTRRVALEKLQDSVPTSIVACADWLGEAAKEAGIRNVTVVKNSVDQEFWDHAAASPPATESHPNQVLFVCRDLRDPAKVDWELLEKIALLPNLSLTIMGNNAPKVLPGVKYLAATSSRKKLADVYSNHRTLIFTSNVDYFPLTIAEALTCGMEVLAIDSKAAREFSEEERVQIFVNENKLVEHLLMNKNKNLKRANSTFFDPARMVSEYLNIYNALKLK